MIKSGFVSIAGRPNAGKSTLLNALLKRKVAIVTPKAQTTNHNIQGILNDERGQIIFVDTPGIHKPINIYGEHLNKQAYKSIRGSDVTLLVIDTSVPFGLGDEYLIEKLKIDNELIIVFAKIDLTDPQKIEFLTEKYRSHYPDTPIIEVSSTRNFNMEDLITLIFDKLQPGPIYYPHEDDLKINLSDYISELIREKIIMLTEQEIPYSVAVIVDHIEEDKKIEAHVSVLCEKDSQKGILIGAGAKMIKRIRLQSQYDLAQQLNKPVLLELMVKVVPNWRSDPKFLQKLLK